MYEKELMMAIIISSTTLVGLEGVVIGQIMQSNLSYKIMNRYKAILISVFVLAIITIICAIGWFILPIPTRKLIAIIVFGIQISMFSGAVTAFWLSAKELQ
jgi:hypothetical protein